ncbi:hypothetical protein AB0O33_37895, partial [Streptomyces sp. NPDC089795]
MTDLLHRLASRAAGRPGRPATVLPPRPAAERASREREPVGPGEDTASREATDGAARPPDAEAPARGSGTGRGPADGRSVHGPAAAAHGPHPAAVPALPGRGTPLSPLPPAAGSERGSTHLVRRPEPQDTAPHRPSLAAPVHATPATAAAPSPGAPAVRAVRA